MLRCSTLSTSTRKTVDPNDAVPIDGNMIPLTFVAWSESGA